MFKKTILTLSLILAPAGASFIYGWGNWGHQHINRAAIFALPREMSTFFYNHSDFITEESTVPDLRKYTINDKAEFPRHYIDVESFGSIDSIPRLPKEAYAKYDEKFLQKNGILPWYLQEMMDKLTKAFQNKRKTEILFLAADLGHYLGDAHMPLHTSLNHDGQLTNQKGIHAFWESQLPELFGKNYSLHTSSARYITDVTKESWAIIMHSHLLADSVLLVERNLSASIPQDQIFKKDEKGNFIKNKFNQNIHTDEYARKYHEALNGMVERQMRAAVQATTDFWYTAWVNAGKPDLSRLDSDELTKRNSRNFKADYKLWEQGKVSDMMPESEF